MSTLSGKNSVSLQIDKLNLQLPESLGARRFHIAQLLRTELTRMQWPQGEWPSLTMPPLSIAKEHTDIRIARTIALHIYNAANRRARLGAQA